MITETLTEYMNNVYIKNKDISEYKNNENGTRYIMPTGHLLAKVDYLELTEKEYEAAIYKLLIDKNKNYKKAMSTRPTLKNEITGKDEDKNTIVDAPVMIYRVWNVSNGLGIKESFTTKKEAIKLYNDINKKVLRFYE